MKPTYRFKFYSEKCFSDIVSQLRNVYILTDSYFWHNETDLNDKNILRTYSFTTSLAHQSDQSSVTSMWRIHLLLYLLLAYLIPKNYQSIGCLHILPVIFPKFGVIKMTLMNKIMSKRNVTSILGPPVLNNLRQIYTFYIPNKVNHFIYFITLLFQCIIIRMYNSQKVLHSH